TTPWPATVGSGQVLWLSRLGSRSFLQGLRHRALRGAAGIDRQDGPRNALRPVSEQKLDGVRHVIDGCEPAQRAPAGDSLTALVVHGLGHGRLQETGGNRVHVDAHATD